MQNERGWRRCNNCRETKKLRTDFHHKGRDASGKRLYQYHCASCHPEVAARVRKGSRSGEHAKEMGMRIRASQNRVTGSPERMEPAYADA